MLRRRLSIAATGLACAVWPALPGAGMPQGGPGAAKPFDVTVRGFGGRDSLLRYETTEHDGRSNVLLVGRNAIFTSVDRITVAPTVTGCDVTYDAKLTFNGLLAPFNLALGLVFNKIGDSAAKGMRKKLT